MDISHDLQVRSGYERDSIQHKKVLAKIIMTSSCLALYFYWRHNEYCEPFVYSFFAMSEYSIVLCNMLYHWLVSYDFHDFIVCISVSGTGRGSTMRVQRDYGKTELCESLLCMK